MPRKEEKRKIAVIDCETDPFEKNVIPQPFIWGYYNGEEYKEFTETDDLINFIKERNEIIYAHNGGKFDFHYLKKAINKYQDIMIINGRLAKFNIGVAEMRDSYCILPVKLSEYNKSEFEYWKLKKQYRKEHWQEIREYLASDCLNLHEFITGFQKIYGNHLTIATCAMKYWSKSTGDKQKTSKEFFNAFKEFYAGGRVQCFESGFHKGNFTSIDINSAYPAAMYNKHPSGNKYNITDNPKEINGRSFVKLECVAKGCFPVKSKLGLSFPIDNELRQYAVTGWEYLTAKKLGLIKNENISKIYNFDETVCFKSYVDKFFKIKKESKVNGVIVDKVNYISSKLFLNSLYGKFAANPDKYENYIISEGDRLDEMLSQGWEYNNEFTDSHLLSKPIEEERKHYYNVATAASITGYVRAYLLETLHKVEKPYYCDTDSITFSGKHNIKLGEELGQWNIDFESDSLATGGKKLYSFRNKNDKNDFKIASKGAKLTAQEIYRICKNQDVVEFDSEIPIYSFKQGIYFRKKKIQKTI